MIFVQKYFLLQYREYAFRDVNMNDPLACLDGIAVGFLDIDKQK